MRYALFIAFAVSTVARAQDSGPASQPTVDDLRKEYESIREALFTSRAKAAAVGAAMYSSKITVKLHDASARFRKVDRAVIQLDGAGVFEDTDGKVSSDDAPRFDGFVAPGNHTLSIRLEAEAKDDGSFTTATEDTFVIVVPDHRQVTIDATAEDDGDIAYKWKKKTSGTYRLHLDVDISTKELKANAAPAK
jgi:hypothetical protein